MVLEIELKKLEEYISNSFLINNGDEIERIYGALLKERFPNYEQFWRNFIIPATKRIELLEVYNIELIIDHRENLDQIIYDIVSYHYSIFLNLIYAHIYLFNSNFQSFEDFYTHLVSICDLTEDFLLKIYLLILECNKSESKIFQNLTREEFLKIASEYYDKKYPSLHEHYLKKGKIVTIRIPSQKSILNEYFNDYNYWKEYKTFSQHLRTYRNQIVHNIKIATIGRTGHIRLVPKKEKISNYRSWLKVFEASSDRKIMNRDFINMTTQMNLDIQKLEGILDRLWIQPIKDLKNLFYEQKNEILSKKYNLEFIF